MPRVAFACIAGQGRVRLPEQSDAQPEENTGDEGQDGVDIRTGFHKVTFRICVSQDQSIRRSADLLSGPGFHNIASLHVALDDFQVTGSGILIDLVDDQVGQELTAPTDAELHHFADTVT